MVATLIQTAKLNNVEPLAWLTDTLRRIVSGQTKRNQLDTLLPLPWNWKQHSDVAPVTPLKPDSVVPLVLVAVSSCFGLYPTEPAAQGCNRGVDLATLRHNIATRHLTSGVA
jgi:hypothetical protein